jgi:NADH-quinone oxidoreductase subunit L
MFMAAGAGAYDAAIFLMVAHAFYKALLFLGAGSVIHAMNDEQRLKRMGALYALMPVTAVTFLLGWLAIGGVPPLAGFWAKGAVLQGAWAKTPALWAIGAVAALLTAYYIGREYFLVFRGERRWDVARSSAPDAAGALHPHDPRMVMRLPLMLLAVGAVFGGLFDLPFVNWDFLNQWLAPVFGTNLQVTHFTPGQKWAFAIVDGTIALIGVGLATAFWRKRSDNPALEPVFLSRAWFIDYGYDRLIARPCTAMAGFFAYVIDSKVIDGAVNGFAAVIRFSAVGLRRVQSGYVRSYALGIAAGLVIVLAFVLARATS